MGRLSARQCDVVPHRMCPCFRPPVDHEVAVDETFVPLCYGPVLSVVGDVEQPTLEDLTFEAGTCLLVGD